MLPAISKRIESNDFFSIGRDFFVASTAKTGSLGRAELYVSHITLDYLLDPTCQALYLALLLLARKILSIFLRISKIWGFCL